MSSQVPPKPAPPACLRLPQGSFTSISRCEVRPPRLDDAPAIAAALNDRGIWRNVRDRVPHPHTLGDAQQFLEFACSQDPPCHFAIVVDGQAAGMVGLEPQGDVYRRSAELGFWLGRRHWRRGIASEAVAAVVSHGFTAHPHLHRIFAHCLAWNEGALPKGGGWVPSGSRCVLAALAASPHLLLPCLKVDAPSPAPNAQRQASLQFCMRTQMPGRPRRTPTVGSQALLRKQGFVQEGRLRQAAFKDGQLVDELAFALLRPEWEAWAAAGLASSSAGGQAGGPT